MNKETIQKILKFRDERNWKQFHSPKDLAILINFEAFILKQKNNL